MSFCRLSNDRIFDNYTLLDNKFVLDFMPDATDDAIKVYILGLHFCANLGGGYDEFKNALGLSEDKIYNAFRYWEEMNLVSILSINPLEIVYLNNQNAIKKFKSEKYSDFNIHMSDLFPTRALMPNEFMKYYEFIEDTKIEPEALLMIAGYCVNLKGSSIRHNYILTVAKDWTNEGVLNVDSVEEKLKSMEANTEELRQIFLALGKTSRPDFEDKQLLLKWKDSWGFDNASILFGASLCKKKGGMPRLDSKLDEFFRHGAFSVSDMQAYDDHKQRLLSLTKVIVRALGLYYENYDYIIESYTVKWIEKGFDDDALISIAKHCMKKSIRTLEGMNSTVSRFYKLGLLNTDRLDTHFESLLATDSKIKEFIEASGSSRNITNSDREFYKTWGSVWNFSDDIILYACSLAENKPYSFSYVNQILASWKDKKISTLSEAKAQPVFTPTTSQQKGSHHFENERTYSKEDIDALFFSLDNIDDIEV